MKRVFALLLIVILSFSMLACGAKEAEPVPANEPDEASTTEEVKAPEEADGTAEDSSSPEQAEESMPQEVTVSAEDFEITEYLYLDPLDAQLEALGLPPSHAHSYFVLAKNNAEVPVSLFADAVGKDSSGAVLAEVSTGLNVLGPGESGLLRFSFFGAEGLDSVKYEMRYVTPAVREPMLENLSVEQTIDGKDVNVSVTNNGSSPEVNLLGTVLFFDADNNLIYFANDLFYVMDEDIVPGQTVECTFSALFDFDHCEVYFSPSIYKK